MNEPDIDQIAKQYFLDIADTLEETMIRFNCQQYENLWKFYIDDARALANTTFILISG